MNTCIVSQEELNATREVDMEQEFNVPFYIIDDDEFVKLPDT
jgi:hypothetical protein